MTTTPKPPAEVTIEPSLVRALLQEQRTDLAHLALIEIGEGWDNRLFRLYTRRIQRGRRRHVDARTRPGTGAGTGVGA